MTAVLRVAQILCSQAQTEMKRAAAEWWSHWLGAGSAPLSRQAGRRWTRAHLTPGAGAAGVDVVGEPAGQASRVAPDGSVLTVLAEQAAAGIASAECLALVPLLRKTLKCAAPRPAPVGAAWTRPSVSTIRYLPCMHALAHEPARQNRDAGGCAKRRGRAARARCVPAWRMVEAGGCAPAGCGGCWARPRAAASRTPRSARSPPRWTPRPRCSRAPPRWPPRARPRSRSGRARARWTRAPTPARPTRSGWPATACWCGTNTRSIVRRAVRRAAAFCAPAGVAEAASVAGSPACAPAHAGRE